MQLASVDLSKKDVKISSIPESWMKEYIGGKGIATKLLYEKLKPSTDPLSPENTIIFGIGPVNGLTFPGASRLTCVFKSPMTSAYGESQCGGFISREFGRSGIDFLLITGKSDKPVYIVVRNGEVEIKDAGHIWGKDTFETEDILRKDEKGEVLSIGQAGENLVRFACISHRKGRQFGRAGAGAVMGSKMLKAIVVDGDGEPEIAYPNELREFRKTIAGRAKERLQSLSNYGTPGIMALTNEMGVLPTRYWSKGSFEGFEEINAEAVMKYVKKHTSCFGCPVACGLIVSANGIEIEGPEYETLYALGSLCENTDLKAIFKAAELCDRYGMDTISAGNAVAFLMACSERGEVEERVEFGDGEATVDLVRKIALREGIGDVLAEGTKRASKIFGTSVEPVHVKGLEPPGYDPRGLYGMALAYAVSPRGACHMRSCAYRPNLVGAVDRLSPESQATLVKDLEDMYCVVDSLVLCRFLCLPIIGPMFWEDLGELYRIVTGKRVAVEHLKKVGERICNLTRAFNKREGVKEDKLPEIFFKSPIKLYERSMVVEKEDFERMLEEYYRLRGWEKGGD